MKTDRRRHFDDLYMELADRMAAMSHCIRKHVGAVIAKDNRIISTGYNGPPAGTYNCDEHEEFRSKGFCFPGNSNNRPARSRQANSCYLSIHAEQNAILYAVKNRTTLDGATLYLTLAPCISCARLIYHSGIRRVLYKESYAAYKELPTEEGVDFLKEFNVEVVSYGE